MNKKLLTLLASFSFALFMSACGDDSSSSASVECLDNENCLDEDLSSSSEDDASSSSVKSSKDKSSSSVKKDEKSSSSAKDAKSSSSTKDEKSSSSEKKDEKSSSSEKVESSSSEKPASSSSEAVSSSSEEPESSSSVELKVTYLSDTPNAADLEVSGDTLFAVFQRYVPVAGGAEFKDPGLLAMFKLSDGTLLDTIPLLTKNPMSVKVVKGNVYVGTQGEYNPTTWGCDADDNRGIEKIDLKKKKSELWVSGEKLGGGVYSMEVNAADGKAYVAVYKFYGTVPVVEVDLASKTVKSVGDVMDGSGGLFYDADAKLLYIGDRGFMDWNSGDMGNMFVHVYDGKTVKAATDEDGFLQSYSITKAGSDVFVYVSDYNSGALYWIEDDDFSSERVQFSSDAIIRNVSGKLIVLDRGGAAEKGNIVEVDPAAKSVSWQKAFETKVNPYDIVAINGSDAWVALYDVGEIRKISLADGSTISSIDTKEFSAKTVEEVTDAE